MVLCWILALELWRGSLALASLRWTLAFVFDDCACNDALDLGAWLRWKLARSMDACFYGVAALAVGACVFAIDRGARVAALDAGSCVKKCLV